MEQQHTLPAPHLRLKGGLVRVLWLLGLHVLGRRVEGGPEAGQQ